MADINKHIEKLINMLQSPNSNTRYEACEHLRVAPAITPEAITALVNALKDPNESVVDAAKRALDVQLAPTPSSKEVPQQILPASDLSRFPGSVQPRDITPPYPSAAQQMPSGSPNTPEYIFALEKRIMILEEELRRTSEGLNQAITLSNSAIAKIPNSAIVSPSFLSRAFAVWGHYFIAQLMIAIPIYCIFFFIIQMAGINR